ncbi:MAG: hypothetical protein Q9226_006428 [Calogaya cf. arnoldii]
MDRPQTLTAHLPFRFLKARQLSIEESETLCKQTVGADVKNPPNISLPLWVLTSHPKKETQNRIVLQAIKQSTDNKIQTFSAAFDPSSSRYTFDAVWTQAVGPHVPPSDAVAFQHLPGPPRAFRAYVHHSTMERAVSHQMCESCTFSPDLCRAIVGKTTKEDGVNTKRLARLQGSQKASILRPTRRRKQPRRRKPEL